jgi:dephospho-CoA kinase
MKLIGIGGTNAAGKDTVAEMLAERHGWQFVSVSDILRDELRREGKPIERRLLRSVSAKWREEFGLGILIDKAVELYNPKKYNNLVISSLRNFGEADEVHKLGGKVVWVDADMQVRYDRIQSRMRSAERNEMHHKDGNQNSLNLSGVAERADIKLENNGDDVEVFKDAAEKALKKYI